MNRRVCAAISIVALNACAAPTNAVPQFPAAAFRTRVSEPAPTHHIYVANPNSNSITTYTMKGVQTAPTITTGIDTPAGTAVDSNGKIYVANAGNNTVTTYDPDGTQTTPTITVKERNIDTGVQDVAVGKNGKIYVLNGSGGQGGDVTTYGPDGTPLSRFNVTNANSPIFLAVDGNGRVYVTVYFIDNNGPGRVFTFSPDGKRTTPTLSPIWPWGVAVDAQGKIYVAAGPGIVTFTPDGKPTQPRIQDHDQFGNGLAYGVTVDSRGYIYAANCASTPCGSITTYKPDGSKTSPTITQGLANPVDVAVH